MPSSTETLPTVPFTRVDIPGRFQPETAGLPIDTERAVLRADRDSARTFAGQLTYGRDTIAGIKSFGTGGRKWRRMEAWKRFGEIENFGGEHLIYAVPGDASRLVGVRHRGFITAEDAKKTQDIHTVVSTILPFNFPRIDAVTGVPAEAFSEGTADAYLCVNIREKVPVDEGHTAFARYTIRDAASILDHLGAHPTFLFDWAPRNWRFATDGGQYYIDMASHPDHGFLLRPHLIEQWMRMNPVADKQTGQLRDFTDQEHTKVQEALERISQNPNKTIRM